MPTVYLLIGAPASGKSTWTQQYVETTGTSPVIVSSDTYIENYAAERNTTYSVVYDEAADMADKACKQDFKNAILAKSDIIVDRTNMSRKTRRRWLSQLPAEYQRVGVVFQVPREVLDDRNALRAQKGKNIPKFVMDQMLRNYQEPDETEFSDIRFV